MKGIGGKSGKTLGKTGKIVKKTIQSEEICEAIFAILCSLPSF